MQAYTLPRASEEQKEAIKAINRGSNVIVDSVAGSGKTTTVLYIAKVFPQKKILLLTYNAKLKVETRAKVELLGLCNLEVHSYHSFGVKYVSNDCSTDAGIIAFVKKPRDLTLPTYDLVIIDEAQDMTRLYYEFLGRVISRQQICVLGDKFQSIYAFNGADERFITFADRVFTFNTAPWEWTILSTSYRITTAMADFMNRCVLGYDRLRAVKDGPKPRYIIDNPFSKTMTTEVRRHLRDYKPSDIFILAPSIRTGAKSPIRRLANELSGVGIPIYVPSDDDKKLDEEILAGKLVFSSFHQAKGLERKVVIVYGFDSSYYEFFNKEGRRESCPNELYVALTRASERMSIFHSDNKAFLPFMTIDRLYECCDVVGEIAGLALQTREHITTPVTELIKHLPSRVLNRGRGLLNVTQIEPPGDFINIPTKTAQENPFGDTLYEEVSDITGTAIPAYYQYCSTGCMRVHEILSSAAATDIKLPPDTSTLLKLANQYNSHVSQLIFKINQIHDYNWLSEDNLEKCIERMQYWISWQAEVEKGIKVKYMGRELNGFIDVIDQGGLWEIKCVSELTTEHVLQTALYAYMYEKLTRVPIKYKLFNILSGEILEVSAADGNLEQLVRLLIHSKYHTRGNVTDEEFIEWATARVRPDVAIVEQECTVCGMFKTPAEAEEIITKKKIVRVVKPARANPIRGRGRN